MAFVAHLYNNVNDAQQSHGNELINYVLENGFKKLVKKLFKMLTVYYLCDKNMFI